MKKINRRERRESCACTGSVPRTAMRRGSVARPSIPPPPPPRDEHREHNQRHVVILLSKFSVTVIIGFIVVRFSNGYNYN